MIGNQGLVKDDQKSHCGFPINVNTFVQNDKSLSKPPQKQQQRRLKNYNRHQQEKVRDKGWQSNYINYIIMFEDIMINQHQNI